MSVVREHLVHLAHREHLVHLSCPAEAVGCSDVGVAGGTWVPVAIVIFAVAMVSVAILAFRRR